jgi:hypothetical protein
MKNTQWPVPIKLRKTRHSYWEYKEQNDKMDKEGVRGLVSAVVHKGGRAVFRGVGGTSKSRKNGGHGNC